MKKKILLAIFFFVAKLTNSQTVTTLHIDPSNAYGGTTSELFDSISFIPLETNKESLFGQIDQLELTPNYFIILDNQSNSILIFGKNGKFHTKIKTGGSIEFFNYFSLNREDNEIIACVNNKDEFFIFNYDGELIRKEISPSRAKSLYYFNKSSILYQINRPYTIGSQNNIQYDLAYSAGHNNISKELLPYNSKFAPWDFMLTSSTLNYSGEGGSCMFSIPYDYNVYELIDTGIIHQYKFIFPLKYSLPQDFAVDSAYTGRRRNYITSPDNFGKINWIQKAYKVGNKMLFTIFYFGPFSIDRNYIYNLENGSLISLEHVAADSSSYFIPVINYRFAETIHSVSDNYIYSSIPAVILNGYKKDDERKIKYSPELETFFATGSKNDNPIIIQMKSKKNQND